VRLDIHKLLKHYIRGYNINGYKKVRCKAINSNAKYKECLWKSQQ
jgi:hypothetical protein